MGTGKPSTPANPAVNGDSEAIVQQLQRKLQQRPADQLSRGDRLNLRLLEADFGSASPEPVTADHSAQRIAIVSLLFNWPSTGGGIVHTAELAQFLTRAGFEVCHFYAVHEPWEMGSVSGQLPYPSTAIHFDQGSWNRDAIIDRFRSAVQEFQPDAVIVTDSWNTKPMLATAVSEFPYFLRLAALECLCPLNNVRLIPGRGGQPIQCHKSQLATRKACIQCVADNQHASGPLHEAERRLAMFHDLAYDQELRAAFANATGVLAVNPLIGALCEPHTRCVHVIPSGFAASRFDDLPAIDWNLRPFRMVFAGLIQEYMKGFHVLMDACRLLWEQGQVFEVHVTADEGPHVAPFLKYRGWQSQETLPGLIAECHALVVPTIAQEALGRTAVEAMGASRPVVASRIGGLPFTVVEGLTGLLAEPADAADLARQIQKLMDDRALAERLGKQGRERFDEKHTWQSVIERQYRPLFASIGVQP